MTNQVPIRTLLLCGAVEGVGLLACGGEVPAGGLVVRDSAGVTIVESHSPRWTSGEEWVAFGDSEVKIGAVEGAAPYRLFGVEDATVLSDGRIVVVNRGTHDVRIYSQTGGHLRTFGGEGEGPGEFRYPLQVYRLPGDSLVVVDLSRISHFDPAGGFVRSHLYSPPAPQDRFVDGSFLIVGFAAGADLTRLGTVRPPLALIRMRPRGFERDTIAVLSGGDRHFVRTGTGIAQFRPPFGRVRSTAIAGEEIVTGDGSAFEFAVLAPNGSPVRIVRRTADLTLRSDAIARFEEAYLSGATNEQGRRLRAQVLRESSYPDRQPAYDRLLVDGIGNVWARQYMIPDEPSCWSVFDASGRWLGIVRMPVGLQVFEIGDDYVLGMAEDSLGIEYVQLHVLEKPAAGSRAPAA